MRVTATRHANADAPVACAGYDLTGLADGATESFRALLGLPPVGADAADVRLLLPEPDAALQKLLREAKALHNLR